jgi:hypothetical protein
MSSTPDDVGAPQVRDALLALAVIPVTQGARYGLRLAEASARTAARLIDRSPLKGPVLELQNRWKSELSKDEGALNTALEDALVRLLDRFDPTELIIERVNINQIVAERVDIQAIIDRVDVVALARQVVAELDIPEIVRESSQTMAAETVDGLRERGVNADRFVSDLIDRMLRRKGRQSPALERPPRAEGTT